MKPHIEIENDPSVCTKIEALIQTKVLDRQLLKHRVYASKSLVLKVSNDRCAELHLCTAWDVAETSIDGEKT
jgi:hypothetical protein